RRASDKEVRCHRGSQRIHPASEATAGDGAFREGRLCAWLRLQGAQTRKMNVLIDTSVWSLAFRRSRASSRREAQMVEELTELIQEGRALLFGPIRQELLSGISDVR